MTTEKNIPLAKPYLPPETAEQVQRVLDSGFITEGDVTSKLEQMIADYISVRNAIAVTSCTVGLEIALRCLGVGPGDEVVVPDYTYPATALAVQVVGAVPVVVDVDPLTMLMDMNRLEESLSEKTKVVMPVSLFGNPVDWTRLSKLKKRHGFRVVEDAACALGAEYANARIGSLADISVFSFHPRKFVTTGEGGVITTDNDAWSTWIRSYKRFGIMSGETREQMCFEHVGSNHKLSDILSAVGVGQMQHIRLMLRQRRELAKRYDDAFAGMPGIDIPKTTQGGIHSYQAYCLLVDDRDSILDALREKGIEAQIGTYSLHMHPAFHESKGVLYSSSLSGSSSSYARCLALPLYHELSEQDQDIVIRALKRLI